MEADFHARLDRAILSGQSSQAIAREFGIRSESVRKRRAMIRRGFIQPAIESAQCATTDIAMTNPTSR